MVVTKDRPHGPGRSIPMFIVVECEDHSAIQAPLSSNLLYSRVSAIFVIVLKKDENKQKEAGFGRHYKCLICFGIMWQNAT